ncbi:MAG TPA: sigma-70 family RNA polymerase sigma factor [Candidatus Nanoarchaeia archaeon]|nr:sigma-70 family RNA polymerase sigma factor [Candidatus Nanoarchaeia archaeon]
MTEDLQWYKQEAARYPALDQQQESSLVKKIEKKGKQLLWAIFSQNPDFFITYFARQSREATLDEEKAGLEEFFSEVTTTRAGKIKVKTSAKTEEHFYEALETLWTVYDYSNVYAKMSESYLKYLQQGEKQVGQDSEQEEIQKQKKAVEKAVGEWSKTTDKMVQHHLYLALSLAESTATPLETDADALNYVQQGKAILQKAVHSYDYSQGKRFSSYATQRIRQGTRKLEKRSSTPAEKSADAPASLDMLVADPVTYSPGTPKDEAVSEPEPTALEAKVEERDPDEVTPEPKARAPRGTFRLKRGRGRPKKSSRNPWEKEFEITEKLSGAFSFYLQELSKYPLLSAAGEQQKFKELGKYRNALYAAINGKDSQFIDDEFGEFRKQEKEEPNDTNRWHFLNDISLQYLQKVNDTLQKDQPASDTYKELEGHQGAVTELYSHWSAVRNEIMRANLRLVVHRAKMLRIGKVSLEDRVADGNFGLLRAIDSFDPEMENKFSTYAVWWINQTISRRFADTATMIRRPVHLYTHLSQIRRAEERCRMRYEREDITPEEIAEDLMQEAKHKARLEGKEIDKEKLLTAERIAKIFGRSYAVVQVASLDVKVGEMEDREMLELIPNEKSPNPEEEANMPELAALTERVLSDLNQRDQMVIRLRMGFGYGNVRRGTHYTLQQVADELGLSRERIRQIEAKALARLRHPNRAKLLEGFLEGE